MNLNTIPINDCGQVIPFEIGVAYFFNDYIYCEMNEGVLVSFEAIADLIAGAKKYYGSKDFGYISNRKNSYSVVPTDYEKLKTISNLKAIAIICENKIGAQNTKIEKMFFQEQFETFDNFEDAILWIKGILKKAS
jgi:hypothetical protein